MTARYVRLWPVMVVRIQGPEERFWCEIYEEDVNGVWLRSPHNDAGVLLGQRMRIPWGSLAYVICGAAEEREVSS